MTTSAGPQGAVTHPAAAVNPTADPEIADLPGARDLLLFPNEPFEPRPRTAAPTTDPLHRQPHQLRSAHRPQPHRHLSPYRAGPPGGGVRNHHWHPRQARLHRRFLHLPAGVFHREEHAGQVADTATVFVLRPHRLQQCTPFHELPPAARTPNLRSPRPPGRDAAVPAHTQG
jgi:hypothetical protein